MIVGPAYPVIFLIHVAHFLENKWTVRSVADSLQDGGLSSVCTPYNEDSELDKLLRLLVSHVWKEARVADRFDPIRSFLGGSHRLLRQSEMQTEPHSSSSSNCTFT